MNDWDQVLKHLPYRPTLRCVDELSALPDMMNDGEKLLALSDGRYGDRVVLVAATSQRLLLIECGQEAPFVRSIPLLDVDDMRFSAWYGAGNLHMHSKGESIFVLTMPGDTVQPLIDEAMAARAVLQTCEE